jgi:hypothetical protein
VLLGVDDDPSMLAAEFVHSFVWSAAGQEKFTLLCELLHNVKRMHLIHRYSLYNDAGAGAGEVEGAFARVLRANPMVVDQSELGAAKFKIHIAVNKNL